MASGGVTGEAYEWLCDDVPRVNAREPTTPPREPPGGHPQPPAPKPPEDARSRHPPKPPEGTRSRAR